MEGGGKVVAVVTVLVVIESVGSITALIIIGVYTIIIASYLIYLYSSMATMDTMNLPPMEQRFSTQPGTSAGHSEQGVPVLYGRSPIGILPLYYKRFVLALQNDFEGSYTAVYYKSQ